jgi:eukaryotic-like serine/threonine-protein kinase
MKCGDIIRDTYTVEGHLGSGAFGDVYLVRHRYMGMQAMKVLDRVDNSGDRESGLNEAFLLSKIAHPNIVRVFEANHIEESSDSPLYVTMEYVNGRTLREIIDCNIEISLDTCLKYIRQAAEGLSHAHKMNPPIIHRDIRPQNLLLKKDMDSSTVLVGDFGLASSVNVTLGILPAAGSIPYESPEGLSGYEGPESDIFSLGICFYELLTGVFPFDISTTQVNSYKGKFSTIITDAHQKGFRPVSSIRSSIPPEVEAVVNMMLELDPRNRFPNGSLVVDVLSRCERSIRMHGEKKIEMPNDVLDMLKTAFKYKYINDNHETSNAIFNQAEKLTADLDGRFSSFID